MQNTCNKSIRDAARIADVPLWRVAHHLGMTPETLSRKMRFEFSPEETDRTMQAIKELADEMNANKGAGV